MQTSQQAQKPELRRNYIGIVSDRIDAQRAIEALQKSPQPHARIVQAVLHSLRGALLRCKTR
jgi:hypothetical protein